MILPERTAGVARDETDDEWLARFTTTPPDVAATLMKEKKRAPYYPDMPLHIVHAIVAKGAESALPLVLAAHRRMFMRKFRSTALTKSIWQAAGLPNDDNVDVWRRRTALVNLRKIPDVLVLVEKRSPIARYWVSYGPLWKRTPQVYIEDE